MEYFAKYSSPIGELVLVSDGANLTRLYGGAPPVNAVNAPENSALKQAARWLDDYFSGRRPSPGSLPLAPAGSSFRRLALELLCRVPYGRTTTYGELARQTARAMGVRNMSAQAIGNAVANNPIPIIIPCHRVLAAGGGAGGYSGFHGLETKRRLLALEGVELPLPGQR